jgi:hypothetical protein
MKSMLLIRARRSAAPVCLVICSAFTDGVAAQSVVLGALTGPTSPQRPEGVQLFGTDLGWTFEHKGSLQIILGDTWTRPDALCAVLSDGFPAQDDAQGTLPLQYTGGVPSITIATQPSAPTEVANTLIYKGSQLLRTSQNAGAMTAFSDGDQAIAVYQSTTFVACGADGGCPTPLACSVRVGQCEPALLGVPSNCDLDALGFDNGCVLGQVCADKGPGFCVDPDVPLADVEKRVALELELAVQREEAPTRFDSRFTFYSSRFINMTARTVTSVSSDGDSDYRRGYGELLLWGRPGFVSDRANNQPLYLLRHSLPLYYDENARLKFQPRYFAGLDAEGRPTWSEAQNEAQPLALDGQRDGSPYEVLPTLNQLTVTWLEAPIARWVMFYGGGSPLSFTGPATAANGGVEPGAIAVRFAEHPWGPWSPPQTLLAPGAANTEGALYGPGGSLYHPSCVDSAGSLCARSDPARYTALLNNSCAPESPSPDYGVLYAPGIIEPYTTRTDDGFDVYWTVSSWNPYITLFVRSHISTQTALGGALRTLDGWSEVGHGGDDAACELGDVLGVCGQEALGL